MNDGSPLNNGQMFHKAVGLSPENCPKDSSKKNSGIPAMDMKKKYGIRNAPEMKNRDKTLFFSGQKIFVTKFSTKVETVRTF